MFKLEDAELRAALNAGWTRSDLLWESLQESANRELATGRRYRSMLRFVLAYVLGTMSMAHSDPRRITGLANLAFTLRLLGTERLARHTFGTAKKRWSDVDSLLQSIKIAPRARSSLFHMRMEALHRDKYRANARARLAKFVGETGESIERLAVGDAPPHRHYSRWLGEKLPVFDDTRKILAACLLLAADDTDRT